MRRLSVVYLFVAACGGPPDLTGTYMVTAHTVSSPTCDAPAPATDPAYVVFEQSSLLGQEYFSYEGCNDAAGTDCPFGAGLLFYAEEIDDGWRAAVYSSSSGGGTSCILSYISSDAILRGDTLTIDTVEHEDGSDRPEIECDPDTAQSLGTSMPCIGVEHIEATAI
jgi:hypothetical protein